MSEQNPKKLQDLTQILTDLKSDYLKSFPEKLNRLRSLTEAKDWADLASEYHKLKGTGKTYGYPEISQICERLEWFFEEVSEGRPPLYFKLEESLQFVGLIDEIYRCYLARKSMNLQSHALAKRVLAMPMRK